MKYFLLLCLISGCASAQQYVSTERTYDERLRARAVSPLTSNLFGDIVNDKDGTIQFSQKDVEIPTNSGLKVEFVRHSPRQNQGLDYPQLPMGSGWELDIPYMMATYDTRFGWQNSNGARCSAPRVEGTVGPSPDYNTRVMSPSMYWSGIHINLPGVGYENMLNLIPGHPVPGDGANYVGAAKGFWRISCLPQIKNGAGEGFVVTIPNGTKYFFDWMATRNAFDVLANEYTRGTNGEGQDPTQLLVPTSDVFIYATKVVDKSGNSVVYNFDPANAHQLKSIESNDGARIDISYNTSGQVSQVSAAGKVWTYTYGGPILTEVRLPDQSKWTFSGSTMWWYSQSPKLDNGFYMNSCKQSAAGYRSQDPPSAGNIYYVEMTHPSGAHGKFTIRQLIHGTDNTPGGCDIFGTSSSNFWFGSYGVPNAYMAASLVTKAITGPGMTEQDWNYYYYPSWSFGKDCSAGCTSSTRVTGPDGTITTSVFGNNYANGLNQLLQQQVVSNGVVVKTTNYVYGGSPANYPEFYGEVNSGPYANPELARIKPLVRRETIQDGVKRSIVVNSFDAFARSVSETKSSAPTP